MTQHKLDKLALSEESSPPSSSMTHSILRLDMTASSDGLHAADITAKARKYAGSGPAAAKRVLVVDDEHAIADTLAVIMDRAGFDASAVYSGNEAIEHARRKKPDIIISDVHMPGITGIEAAIRILQFLPDCKMLFFSGQAGTADLLEGARGRGYEFEILTKPVPPAVLLERVRAIMHGQQH